MLMVVGLLAGVEGELAVAIHADEFQRFQSLVHVLAF
jgi:hypothetical protein